MSMIFKTYKYLFGFSFGVWDLEFIAWDLLIEVPDFSVRTQVCSNTKKGNLKIAFP
jgi:hypothetical protein